MKNFSIIIPVYNEELYLKHQIVKLLEKIKRLDLPCRYEIILVENGSSDNTASIAKKLARKFDNLRVISKPSSSYGQAFKEGIKKACYEYIFQFDLDFWDIRFLTKSLRLLDTYDIIIGSKNLSASSDQRPLLRRLISKLIESIIRARFNIRITDTHGLKAARKKILSNQVDKVVCSNHFFDSELIIRCLLLNYKLKELPVSLKEIRASRFPFLVRTQEVAVELLRLLFVDIEKPESEYATYTYKMQKTLANYFMNIFM